MENDEQKRVFLAVALSAIILFGWQYFFGSKLTPPKKIENKVVAKEYKPSTKNVVEKKSSETVATPLETFKFSKNKIGFEVTNKGGVTNIKTKGSKEDYLKILGDKTPFKFLVIREGVSLEPKLRREETSQSGELVLVDDNLQMTVVFKGSENGSQVDYKVTFQEPSVLRFQVHSAPLSQGQYLKREYVFYNNGDVSRFDIDDEFYGDGNMKWFGVDYDYHLFAVSSNNVKKWRYQGQENIFGVQSASPKSEYVGALTFTQKNYDFLSDLGNNLHLAVDFGILGVLAVPILHGLQTFYHAIPNYGVAIIILTIILRIVLFPLQYKSVKSMKKMQTIQPELNKLREKFKDDPQRMQKESMELFKKTGANPLSGCLPLILQMPIFIAFYKVLYSSVELVGAPFIGWITDLSSKDPYYLLPVLMTLAMFLQQKMTPTTTADPAQKKIMLFMPLIFGFIMKDLPSGLTLYMLVSTLLGIVQTVLVQKNVV